jgi:hypothetical protein
LEFGNGANAFLVHQLVWSLADLMQRMFDALIAQQRTPVSPIRTNAQQRPTTSPPDPISRMRFEVPLPSVNELTMNLTSERVDYRYLKVLIVGKALFVKALCEVSAMRNRIGAGLEIQSDPISERNAVLHVKEKLLHC